MTLLRHFRELWVVDTEFTAPSGHHPAPLCAVSYTHLDVYKRQLWDRPVSSKAAVSDPAEDIPADEPSGHGQGEFRRGAEGARSRRASRVGAMSQATAKLQGMFQGVDVTDAVIANVQITAALLAATLLDIKD